MSKFTPGPWKVGFAPEYHDGKEPCDIMTADEQNVIYVFQFHCDEDNENARLISCAPELFEKLLGARIALEALGAAKEVIADFDALIAKIEGE